MLRFALQNLVRNRARTALGLLGLAGATAGVVLLLSISLGARRMIADAMTMANGIIVMRKDSPNPVFSRIPTALEETLVATPGISAVVPEVWQAAYSIDGKPRIHAGLGNVSALLGVDPAKRAKMRGGGLFARTLVRGRLFRADEPDGLMISAKLAGQLKKEPGATVVAMNMSFTLTGIFDTGTPVFDNVLVAQEDRVRGIADMRSSSVSAFYCEVQSGANVEDVAEEIRKRVPTTVDAESTVSWGREVNSLVAELDPYLGAIALVAGTIGALGVVNTMLMSVRERVREIGVLRATGWH
ncbi:MAG TPA: ABC transporter permease, partial [Planctomycetota bacterium]|nr:ABC transporter permease [Planctomycetota bacterium]